MHIPLSWRWSLAMSQDLSQHTQISRKNNAAHQIRYPMRAQITDRPASSIPTSWSP